MAYINGKQILFSPTVNTTADEEAIYNRGYEKGYADAMAVFAPPLIEFVSTLENVHMNSGVTAGESESFWWEYEGYHIHYYEFSKGAKGGKIQIDGALSASFSNFPSDCICVVNDGVVAISQDNLVVAPLSIGVNSYTITLPDDVTVNGIFLNNWVGDVAPVCTYIE